jgi:hypothetical protein
MSLTEGMQKYWDQYTSTEPVCQKCGRPAQWALQPIGHYLAFTRAPETRCQLCLTNVAPVHVPVYSDAPRENPNERFDFDGWMERQAAAGVPTWRQWPGYDVFLGIAGDGRVWRAREFVLAQVWDSPEVLAQVIDGLCRMAAEAIAEEAPAATQDAPPAEGP